MRRFWISSLLLLAVATSILAAIALDGTPDASTEAGADTVHTSASFTVAANANRLLYVPFGVTVTIGNNATGDFNGDAVAQVSGCYANAGAGSVSGDCLFLVAPDAATDGVDITIDTSGRLLQMPFSLYNVNQSSPIRDVDNENGTTGTSTTDLTLTTVAGDFVVSCITVRRDAGADPGSGLVNDNGTQLEELYNSLGTRFSCSYQEAVGATTTVGWSGWTASNGWVHTAVSIEPIILGSHVYYQQMRNQ